MTTFSKILAATALLLATGCINEEPAYKKGQEGTLPAGTTGYLMLGEMSMRVIRDSSTDTQPEDTGNETQNPSPASRAGQTQPADDGFVIEIVNSADEVVLATTYGELNAWTEPKPLPVGSYTLKVYSESPADIPAVAWNHPVYGTSYNFTIEKKPIDQPTTIDEVICTLQNIKVTLECSADLAADLTENTVSTVSLGDTKITFAKGEQKAAYFMPTASENTLEFQLKGSFNEGGNASFSKSIPGVKAGQWRKITLVITHANLGGAKFDIEVDTFLLDDEVIVNGSANLWEPLIKEEPEIAPTLIWRDHDLTQPFQLLASMFSQQNGMYVCTEPFAFDLASENGIGAFEVTIASTNPDFLTALETLYRIPASFDLCTIAETDPASRNLRNFGFPVGEAAYTATGFDLAGMMPLVYHYPGFDGTHTISFRIADANDTQTAYPLEAALTLVVDHDHEGTGPTIVWRGYDIDEQQTVTLEMLIDIDITAGPGIKSLFVTIDSEELTPLLPTMGLPTYFDLCDVEGDVDTEGTLANTLNKGLGFPVNDQVKGQTQLPFSITKFVELLIAIPGEHNFVLDVTDNMNRTTTKTIQLLVNE